MNIETIRAKIRAKQYLVYDHALTEGFKDGLSLDDMLYAAMNGEIIEEYPQRKRCLIYALLPSGIPIHILVDYRFAELQFVTH